MSPMQHHVASISIAGLVAARCWEDERTVVVVLDRISPDSPTVLLTYDTDGRLVEDDRVPMPVVVAFRRGAPAGPVLRGWFDGVEDPEGLEAVADGWSSKVLREWESRLN